MQPGDEAEDVRLMVPDLSEGSDAAAEKARLRHFHREDARQVRARARGARISRRSRLLSLPCLARGHTGAPLAAAACALALRCGCRRFQAQACVSAAQRPFACQALGFHPVPGQRG